MIGGVTSAPRRRTRASPVAAMSPSAAARGVHGPARWPSTPGRSRAGGAIPGRCSMRGVRTASLGEAGATTTFGPGAGATVGDVVRTGDRCADGAGPGAETGLAIRFECTRWVTMRAGAGRPASADAAGSTAGATSPGAGSTTAGGPGAVCSGGAAGSVAGAVCSGAGATTGSAGTASNGSGSDGEGLVTGAGAGSAAGAAGAGDGSAGAGGIGAGSAGTGGLVAVGAASGAGTGEAGSTTGTSASGAGVSAGEAETGGSATAGGGASGAG